MPGSDGSAEGRGLKRALGCYLTGGSAAVPRGMLWGFVLGLPAGCYCFCTLPYGGGIVAGPAVALAGPIAGAWLAFHVGAATGLHRAGYRWLILLVPAIAAAMVLTPYAIYVDQQSKKDEYPRLFLELQDEDPALFLAHLRVPRSRAIVEDHLERFLICAGLRSRPEVVDALAALDPHGKDGYALCGVAQYGQPAAMSHLLGQGFDPTRAHLVNGAACNPLHELVEGSSATAPCSGDSEQFVGRPTAAGCRHRAEVAALLIEAGATPQGNAAVRLDGCDDGGGHSPVESGAPGDESDDR